MRGKEKRATDAGEWEGGDTIYTKEKTAKKKITRKAGKQNATMGVGEVAVTSGGLAGRERGRFRAIELHSRKRAPSLPGR